MDNWIDYYFENCGAKPNKTHRLLVQLVSPHLGDFNLSVKQLAEMLESSRRQLYRDIHNLLDKQVGQWIRELRLYKAQWLLNKKQITSLEDLVRQVGFKSPAYFRKIYGTFFNTDPSAHFTNNTPSNLKKRFHECT